MMVVGRVEVRPGDVEEGEVKGDESMGRTADDSAVALPSERPAEVRRPPIDLSRASPGRSIRTRPLWFELLWLLAEAVFVNNSLQFSTRLRVAVLRLFGAKIGAGTVIRDIHVKFPWKLVVGDRCWLGEKVWLHNQDWLYIGHDSVISQESFVTTGSHEFRRTMDLVTKPVRIGDGVWVTSRCFVQMGVEIGDNAVITPGSVVHRSLPGGAIYGGNPAEFRQPRWPTATSG